ncbi:L domain-like protein [Anaeromyces robustus]|uniref:L domain-like protein n=1 Tax=Anaeromyces robustus TaxID=1754192 RepID=A0A1Y1XR57_9FUNG|nr:L domain-like protein [Anaeromyces robustus]|eukprot:ORX88228.1 L domain-like protein [Anaeromyces robustus]
MIYKKYAFVLLLQLLIITIVKATEKNSDCKEIYSYLNGINERYDDNILDCVENERGEVIELRLYGFCLSEEQINTVISHDSLKTIYLDEITTYHSTEYDHLRTCGNLEYFPNAISKLKNLESVILLGFSNYKKGDLKKIPSSVKVLGLGDFVAPQYVIDDLSTLTNLEELQLLRTKIDKNSNTESLKNLNIKKLIVSNDDEYMTTKYYINPNFIKNLKKLETLIIEEYTFTQESMDEISKLTNLKELKLSYCGYDEDVTIEPLKNLKSLEALGIVGGTSHCQESVDVFGGNDCPLKSISKSIFTLTNLKTFNITGQFGSTIPFESLSNLKNIENLDISLNKLNTIPESVKDLKKLKYLNISFLFGIKTLPNFICDFEKLERLDAEYGNIESLPKCIGNLKNLKHLQLKENQLKTLPEKFGELTKLEYIDLEFNELESLPDSFGKLENLTYLSFYYNNLEKLPDSFSGLKNLKELNLSNNNLKSLPKSIGNLKNLEKFHLNSNKELPTLPDSIGDMGNLEYLYLYNCQNIKSLPSSIGNLKKLVELELDTSGIETLPDTIGGLESLERFSSYETNISSIPDSFGDLKNLRFINLNNNYIKELPDSFSNLSNLQELHFFENKFTKFPEVISQLKSLTYL